MSARIAWIACVALLAACGGSGATHTPAAPTILFPASPTVDPGAASATIVPTEFAIAVATDTSRPPEATATAAPPTPAANPVTQPPATATISTPPTRSSPAATATATAAAIVAAPTACPSPEANAPVSVRPEICVRRLLTLGNGYIRLRHDPRSASLYALHISGELYRINFDANGTAASQLAFSAAEIGAGSNALGMAVGPDGALYVVGNANRDAEGMCTVRKYVNGAWSTLATIDWYPLGGTQYDHRCNGIVVSPDNRFVYFNNGSRTEHGEVSDNNGAAPGLREIALTSAVFRVPANGANIVLKNDEAALKASGYLFADGLRNAFDLAFAPDGRLYGTENGPDADFPEELNELREGAHYGFPWRFGAQDNPSRFAGYDPANDRRLSPDFVAVQRGMYQYDPAFPPPPAAFVDPIVNTGPDANQFRNDDGSVQTGPITTFTAHRSPLGLNFDVAGALSGPYKGAGFVVNWGSAGGTLTDRGEDLLLLRFSGPRQLSARILVRGFHRPIDATLAGKKLYVLDYDGGAIWELAFP